MKWICNKCKGTNIETKVWVDPNDDTILDSCGEEYEDNWCRDCEEHTEFELIEDEDKAQLKLEL
jgi:hypothetical protein